MSKGRRRLAACALAASCAFAPCLVAADRSYPVDCLPDRVVSWNPLADNPLSLFGAAFVPGIVVGPPGESVHFQGSLTVASLGFGGSVIVAFDDAVLEDGPGADFIVFENAFFALPAPGTAQDDYSIFAEPGIVEVSADGVQWLTFPYDVEALLDSATLGVSQDNYLALTGLAGLTPTFTGNWTMPNDPATFDAQGVGGISGAGGDAFDLADVGLTEARFIRITDAGTESGFPGAGEGFDLDAVVALHARPAAPATTDSDGDLLSDLEEQRYYGSDPDLADTDGDGVDDGREVAGCRDPTSVSALPWLHAEPRLWLRGTACTEARWTFLGSGLTYDLIRGDLQGLSARSDGVDLGPATCLSDEDFDVRWSCDSETPDPSLGFFYLVRTSGLSTYGRSSMLEEREALTDCP